MELKGNVVCYSRVSTKHDQQEDSLENQELMLQDFLNSHPDLTCVGMFKDQESGKTTERKGYLNMLERVSQGDVSYILAKNNTRLSRSTEISSSLNRVCQRYGCKIFFIGTNEEYNPKDRSHVLMNSIKSAVAEDYVFQQSELAKLTHLIKCRNGTLNKNNETFGYRFNKKTQQMEVVEEEAEIVRLMFELYCFKNMGVSEIGRELAKIGVYGPTSGKSLNANTITKRLKDTAYIGKMAFNKTETELVTGVGAKSTRKKIPKSEWIYADCPAIISEELFMLAQKIREERKHIYRHGDNIPLKQDTQARFRGQHLFATKVFCKECGNPYHHRYGDRKKKVHVYKDSFLKKGHRPGDACGNHDYNQIYEEQLIEVTVSAVNSFLEHQDEIFDNVYRVISEVLYSENVSKKKESNSKLLTQKQQEKEKWLEAYRDAVSMGEEDLKMEFMAKYKLVQKEISELQKLIGAVDERKKDSEALKDRLEAIRNRLLGMRHIDDLTRDDVLMLIDKILIDKDGTIEVHLLFAESYNYKLIPYKEYRKTLKERESSFYLFEMFKIVHLEEWFAVPMRTTGMMDRFRQDMVTR